jgi:hypothetical protein
MFDKPDYIAPARRKEGEPAPQKEPEARPAEKMTPSQQGRYLSALEKKGKEKKTKGKDAAEEKDKDLFQLARASHIKGQQEADTDVGAEGGELAFQMGKGSQQQEMMSEGEEDTSQEKYVAPISSQMARGPLEIASQSKKEKPPEEAVPQPPPLQPELSPRIPNVTQPTDIARSIRAEFIELARQMAESIATLISKAETSISVTLKHPPIFEGASLVVTEQHLARKEFNVTFANLSPDARRLIESTANQQQLRQSLIEKGYTLHMVTIEAPQISEIHATTEPELRKEQSEDSPKKGQQKKQ